MATDKGTPTPKNVEDAAQEKVRISTRAITLIGLMTGPKGARALLRDGSGNFHTVEPGDKIAGRTVAGIDASSLILAKGGDTQRLAVADAAGSGSIDSGNGLKPGR